MIFYANFALFVALSFVYYHIPFETPETNAIFLTISTFLFSIFAGFFISRQGGRYSQIRTQIAEMDGENVGCVLLAKESEDVAKLRLLLVEPKARGVGLGSRLVDECIRFALRVGYKRVVLWTQSNLHPARHIYEKAGFVRTREEPHHSFGHDLVAETWELEL